MLGRTKYDVMKSEEIRLSSKIMFNLIKIMSLAEEEKENDMEDVLELVEVVHKLYPEVITMCHIGYENAKDIFELDRGVLFSGINKMGTTAKKFEFNYSRIINRYAKNLAVAMVIEDEEINTNTIECLEPLLELVAVKSCFDDVKYFVELGYVSNPDNVELLLSLSSPEFSVMDMSPKQIQRINDYHERFMAETIYPKVTCNKDENEKVLTLAHRLSRLK